ncbi:hypothetical protein [Mesorhizobium sp. M4B.F.Ca.ET.150.01.1.1]|uniref:hypothetical protein n=1 Tax=Mesorhizobium sp. M4B.F.Ca.ET.150.01.1.1 TaxID=2563948 RepID=UPI001093C6BA|nr:hypothetical protein [Mesorhizobium sp. M4B.F.Ca.ET.150.01.1.1]TGU31189.1 hypothetical protein EN793_24975 [Mesorhizobium sp. M4B.F.Ca.ET.150.01.1.1]
MGITATDVGDGGSLTFSVAHVSAGADGVLGTADDVLTYDLTGTGTPWVVTDGGAGDLDGTVNGKIQTSWYVNSDAANQAFVLTATDQADGRVATVNFTDAPPPPPDASGAAADLTVRNATTLAGFNVGDAKFQVYQVKTDFGQSSGTGTFDAFVQVQGPNNPPTEQGYNYDRGGTYGDVLSPQYNENTSAQHNKALLLSDIPIVIVDGVAYREFLLDSNEQNGSNGEFISLDSLQIYQETSGNLGMGHVPVSENTPYTPGSGFGVTGEHLVYNLDASGDVWVALNSSLSSGSGDSDIRVLIKDSEFLQDADHQYVYVYSAFGGQAGDWQTGSGFEEWGTNPNNLVTFGISGTKYLDANGDSQTTGDAGLGGVTIFIDKDNSGDLSADDLTTTTAANGTWSFTGLDATFDGLKVYEQLPGGYVQTLGQAGYTIDGLSGEDQSGMDFANFHDFSISGTKYEDLTGDGTSADDTAWSHDPVTIFIDDDNSGDLSAGDRSTTTDASGNWSIGGLTLADVGKNIYEVVPDGSQQTGTLVQTVGNPGSGGTDSGNDFTNFLDFSISGTKYEDLTGDGTSADDTAWSHDPVTIFIDDDNSGDLSAGDRSTTTGAGGAWSIGGLTLADVGKNIYEVVPDGSQQTGILVQTVDNPGSGGTDTGNDFTNFLPPAGQGLTPGFWKNHLDILTQELGEFHSGWNSNTSFETIFEFQNLSKIPGTPSIADALGAKGGGVNHLERSSAAAYLSAAVTAVPDGPGGKPELNFSFSAATSSNPAIIAILNQIDTNDDHTLQPGEVIAAVRDVLNDTNAPTSNFGLTGQPGINDIANAFDAMNNQTHPDASVFLI